MQQMPTDSLPRAFDNLEPIQKSAYVDHLKFRLPRELSARALACIQRESRFAEQRWNGAELGRTDHVVLTIVTPTLAGLILASTLPGIPTIFHLELALDVSFEAAGHLPELYETYQRHFVQPWQSQPTVRCGAGSYTGRRKPGRLFIAYPDEPDRNYGHENCFHIEARHHGARAVRRAGITTAQDLIAFDHVAFWRSKLTFYKVNLERLGRFHDNRHSENKRQRTRIHQCGSFDYNVDHAIGSVLFRNHGYNPQLQMCTAESFVRSYGRGPFLDRIDATSLLP